jgi:hypothetical protein
MFEELFQKVKKWYGGLPWWGKLLGFLVLVLLVVLVILKFVLGGGTPTKPKSDTVHETGVKRVIEAGEKKDKELGTAIATTEKEIAKVETAKDVIETKAADAHGKVSDAGSFADVDKVIKTLIFVLFMSIPFAARAQTVVYDMPTGKDVTINGVAMRAFSLDEYKVLAHIYIDYKALTDWKLQADKELDLYKGMKTLYEQRDENCKGMLLTMTNDRDFWKARLEETQADKSRIIERVGFIGALVLETAALVVWGAVSLTHQ